MTLGQIKQRIRMMGRNYFGSEADRDPFGLEFVIFETANQICRKTDCLVGRRYLDLDANVTDYCAPDIYKVRVVKIKDNDGDYFQPQLYNFSNQMLDEYRYRDTQVLPDAVAVRGMNAISVYPAPMANITQGLLIEGYAQPGEFWVYDSTGTAVANTDASECPLPDVALDCLVFGSLYMRCLQMRDGDGISLFKNEYLDRLGAVESYAATYTRRAI
jgi:hypothetical protein